MLENLISKIVFVKNAHAKNDGSKQPKQWSYDPRFFEISEDANFPHQPKGAIAVIASGGAGRETATKILLSKFVLAKPFFAIKDVPTGLYSHALVGRIELSSTQLSESISQKFSTNSLKQVPIGFFAFVDMD